MKKFLVFTRIILGIVISGCVLNVSLVHAEENDILPEIYIKAVNPGYTVDGVSNVGEMIEIGRKKSDTPISLAGLTIGYTNASGNFAVLAEFPEYSWMTGESILLRLASSPEHELAAMNYAKTLAFKAGPLVIMRGEEILDSVCWTGKDECLSEFKSANPTTLVRNEETGNFEHMVGYEPVYKSENYTVENDDGYGEAKSQCVGLKFSEILSYYDDFQAEQFVEFYNSSAEQILMTGCQIKYKNKFYPLEGVIKPEEYFARYLTDFSVTKNPNNSNVLELVDVSGTIVDKLEYFNGQRKGTSYVFIGYGADGNTIWRTTYAPTPGEPNNYQEFKTCEAGKVINEATGNCVKITTVEEKVCAEGQYLNPLTGRCKKIETTTSKTCKEGYILNEETGRCKKITENTGADYSLVKEVYEEKTSFVALYAVFGVVVVGLGYVIYEFRCEIAKLFRKVFRRSR